MNIKEAAHQSGLSVDTIRFYEKSGMLPRILRDARGWRNFGPDNVEWLRNLERLRATGMPMKEMRRFAVLVHLADPALPDGATERLEILKKHSERLNERQIELDGCKAYLSKKIEIYQKLQGDDQ
jgi:DNA-binding transcriptional MerR regulator